MELKGKRVLFLGDSITEGAGTSSRDKRYTDVFARKTGAAVFNYGIGGTRIARQHNPSENPRLDLNFLDRAEQMEKKADIVVVFGGTNDYGHGDGGIGERGSKDEYCFYGALEALIVKLKILYPTAELVFMTPLHRLAEDSTVNKYGQTRKPLCAYVSAIRELCEAYSIPVLDLYANSGIQPSISVLQELYMKDGLHPTDLGAERVADRLIAFLKTI